MKSFVMHCVLFGVFLVTAIQSTEEAVCIVKDDAGRSLRTVWYDTTYQICCNYRLSQRTRNLECCNGKSTYFSDREICCNGQVYDKIVSKETNRPELYCKEKKENCLERTCCENQVILKHDKIYCCDGVKMNLTDDQVKIRDYLRCCGREQKEIYDISTHLCCANNLFDKINNPIGCCDNDIFITKDFICVQDKKLERFEGFCKSEVYNRMKDTCCDGTLVKNTPEIIKTSSGPSIYNPDAYCCGTSVIKQDELCCKEELSRFPSHGIPNHPNLQCCGSGYYNISKQSCLNGIAVDRSTNQAKCGNELIDTSFQACCANKVSYNISNEKCCEGASYCVIAKDEHCCNGFLMNKNEVCCENIKPCKKRYLEDDDCCFDYERENGQTFKAKQESCYGGQIITVPKGSKPCGLYDHYDPNEYFCCNEQKYHKRDGQCCNGIFSKIPPESGSCCIYDNRAYKFGDKTNPCLKKCNEKEYFYLHNDLCCEQRKFKSTGYFDQCCGAYPYDVRKMGCCGNQFRYRFNSKNIKCCKNTQLYNTSHFRCTQRGRLAPVGPLKGLSDVERLCHPMGVELFDGGVEQACERNHAILGVIDSVRINTSDKEDFQLIIEVRRVRPIHRDIEVSLGKQALFKRRITFVVHIPGTAADCQVNHLKQMNKVIVLFDLSNERNVRRIRKVEISRMSSFFMTKKTFKRHYSLTKAISRHLCKVFD